MIEQREMMSKTPFQIEDLERSAYVAKSKVRKLVEKVKKNKKQTKFFKVTTTKSSEQEKVDNSEAEEFQTQTQS